MADIRVCPLLPENFAAVAAYLAEVTRTELPAAAPFEAAAETRRRERRLAWQLAENPARLLEHAGGHFLRDLEGQVVGTHLAIPVRFVLGERRLLGLLSADLRAEPRAARYSSGMFLAYLRLPGGDFHYATTANLNSGAFWEQRKAPPVPESDVELILPVRYGPFLEELVERRGLGRAARVAGVVGASAGWLARARLALSGALRAPGGLAVSPCSDWERLAALAERHRDREVLTNERSAAYLRWRYEDCPGSERNRVFLVEDGAQQGWAALQLVTLGARGRLREARLMDAVWPRGAMDPTELLRAVLRVCRDECDMIRIKGGTFPSREARALGFWMRRLDGPTSYVAFRSSSGVAAPEPRVHFAAADSDTP